MKVLGVDSSSATASVALVEDDKVISEFFMNAGLTHSQTLAPMIDCVLKNSNTNAAEIDLYAITNGPGSFTGLRIAASTVKAMALALNKPCVGISSLEALAYNSLRDDELVCACMDARREQVYTALFRRQNKKIIRITQDEADTIENLIQTLEKYDEKIEFVGDGAESCYNKVCSFEHKGDYSLAAVSDRYISARNIAYLAQKEYMANNYCGANDLGLNYLRVPQAERQLKERLFRNQGVKT